jgi:hypothetical protein
VKWARRVEIIVYIIEGTVQPRDWELFESGMVSGSQTKKRDQMYSSHSISLCSEGKVAKMAKNPQYNESANSE